MVPCLGRQLAAYALGGAAYPIMSEEEKQLRAKLKKQEEAARGRLGGIVGAVISGTSAGVLASIMAVTSLTPLGDFGRQIATEAGLGAAENVAEGRKERRERAETCTKLLACIQARAAALDAALDALSAEHVLGQNAMQFRPRGRQRLRPPIVTTAGNPPTGVNIGIHLRRTLGLYHRYPFLESSEP